MRLLAGQRPIADTFLGYNVLWFFPVAGLFEITGPNYLVLRWYFFAFCTASGLLTYFVVHGYTRNAWYSAIPAVMVILVPGMLFRNYMPFLGILNAFLLTRAFAMERASQWKTLAWMLAAGLGLGVTFLFRIDLGIFCTLIFLGLTVLFPFGYQGDFLRRSGLALVGAGGGLVLAWAVHLPVWNDARTRGYDRAFLEQYTGWIGMISSEFRQQMADLSDNDGPANPAPAPAPAAESTPQSPSTVVPVPAKATEKPNADSWEDRGALVRAPVSDIFFGRKWTHKSFAISTYLPLLISVISIIAGGIGLLLALICRDPAEKERFLYPLTVLGCALTLLPQFLFFRPDTPHLSEMMVPYLAALSLFVWAAGRCAFCASGQGRRVSAGLFAIVCAAAGAIYFSHAFPKDSSGSIAAKKMASHEFRALNGVNVKVRDREAVWLAGLRDAVLRHSSPGEYVLCLPYSPMINFMTDRSSPMHNLYVDNTVGEAEFGGYFQKLVSGTPPAVIVVDERRINRNEISRFRNWAPQTYAWLWKNYVFVGRYSKNEVFVRPDKCPDPVVPESIEVSD